MSDSQTFEFDPIKAQSNRTKHGIDFSEIEAVFYDPLALTKPDPHALAEDRQLTLGRDSQGRLLVVVWTWRGDNIRIISARPATKNERKNYES